MITVTEKAAEEIQKLIKNSEHLTPFIKVSVKGGGCSGLMYDLEFVQTKSDNENLYEDKGCLLYTSPSPRDYAASSMPSSA